MFSFLARIFNLIKLFEIVVHKIAGIKIFSQQFSQVLGSPFRKVQIYDKKFDLSNPISMNLRLACVRCWKTLMFTYFIFVKVLGVSMGRIQCT